MNESAVYLQKVATKQLVAASLFAEITDGHLAMWEQTWAPVVQAYCARAAQADQPEDSSVEMEIEPLASTADLPLLRDRLRARFARFDAGHGALEPVEDSEPKKIPGRGHRNDGGGHSIEHRPGFKGRIGLHSLPGAESFYQNEKDGGMTPLGKDAAYDPFSVRASSRRSSRSDNRILASHLVAGHRTE
jgi:hypothetical protein